MKIALLKAAGAALLALACAGAGAQPRETKDAGDYPSRPLRFITGFLPGGVSDTIARVVGEKLGERLGQRLVIDGRPGAGGVISMELAATAIPDGYTLLLGTPVVTLSPNFKRKLPFDPLKSFAPVTLLGSSPSILVLHPSLPPNNMRELIAYAKAQSDGLRYASSGQGTTNHLAAELLRVTAGLPFTHVPYKGAAATLVAAMSGEVQLSFVPLLPAIPHIKSGKLKGIAVTGAKRVTALPDLPAIAETVPGYDVVSWYGLLVPVRTPAAIVARLNAETNRVLAMPEVRERLLAQGVEIGGGTQAELAEVIRQDAARWAKLVKEAGIQFE